MKRCRPNRKTKVTYGEKRVETVAPQGDDRPGGCHAALRVRIFRADIQDLFYDRPRPGAGRHRAVNGKGPGQAGQSVGLTAL